MVAVKGLIAAAVAGYMGSNSGSNNSGSEYNVGSYDWTMKGQPTSGTAFCPIDKFVPTFPSGQNQLVAPSTPPSALGLAFGVQNYTCSSANNYTSTGAVAELFDASCMAFEPWFPTVQHDLYNVWVDLIPHWPIQAIIDLFHFLNPPNILGQHFFQPNPITGQGISPVWDMRSNPAFQGQSGAFIVGKGKASIPAPTDPKTDVAWLDVVNIQGDVADEVFRFDTVGGQPPTSCKYGSDHDISVKYVSKYIFYGGSSSYSPKFEPSG